MHVADLVVVPGQHLHAGAVHHHRRQRVDDRGARVVLEVDRDERTLLVAEDAGRGGTLGRRLEGGVHLVDGGRPLHLEHAVGQRGVQQRHADRDAGQLAEQLRVDQADRGRRSGAGRNQRQAARAGPPQVLVWRVDDDLGVGDVVNGRDHAVPDADRFVHRP